MSKSRKAPKDVTEVDSGNVTAYVPIALRELIVADAKKEDRSVSKVAGRALMAHYASRLRQRKAA